MRFGSIRSWEGATDGPERGSSRVWPLLVPVVAGGLAVVSLAALNYASSSPGWREAGGLGLLLVAAVLAEAYPVPVESLPGGYVSLAAVFVVGTALIYGWDAAVLVAFPTRALLELFHRRPRVRLAYNSCVYALGAAAAGAAASLVGDRPFAVGTLFVAAFLAALADYVVNLGLVAAVIARWADEPFVPFLTKSLRSTVIPFALMAPISLMLYILWDRSPLLSAALVGPLIAVVLYERSVHNALAAMRLALTDPLTGLGNRRHFLERLERALGDAETADTPLSLCLIDVDDFKQINDSFGHPVGDRVLVGVGSCLRRGGEAFRVGGDEFALLLPGRDEQEALAIAASVVERFVEASWETIGPVTGSAGVATFSSTAVDRSGLVRAADDALYRAKLAGKDQVRGYLTDPDLVAHARMSARPESGDSH
ncbi:MAG: GGDEF domain-containing protein [Actinomycetota bacterium]|nr:GGDEF domain-containing protein [Actinomycetota bacterium]